MVRKGDVFGVLLAIGVLVQAGILLLRRSPTAQPSPGDPLPDVALISMTDGEQPKLADLSRDGCTLVFFVDDRCHWCDSAATAWQGQHRPAVPFSWVAVRADEMAARSFQERHGLIDRFYRLDHAADRKRIAIPGTPRVWLTQKGRFVTDEISWLPEQVAQHAFPECVSHGLTSKAARPLDTRRTAP